MLTLLNDLWRRTKKAAYILFLMTGVIFFPLTVMGIHKTAEVSALTATCYFFNMGCAYGVTPDKLVSVYAGLMMSLSDSDEYTVNDKRRAAR